MIRLALPLAAALLAASAAAAEPFPIACTLPTPIALPYERAPDAIETDAPWAEVTATSYGAELHVRDAAACLKAPAPTASVTAVWSEPDGEGWIKLFCSAEIVLDPTRATPGSAVFCR